MERCLEQVSAYRAPGLKAKAWVAANAAESLPLQNCCAHACTGGIDVLRAPHGGLSFDPKKVV